LNNSLLERYSLFTTSVKPYTCGFAHQVFGAAAGELTNLINFFLVIRIFLSSFFFYYFFFFLPLTSWVLALLWEGLKVLVNLFPRSKDFYIKERE